MIEKNNPNTVEMLQNKVLQLTSDNEALREELDERDKRISSLEVTLDREREELSDNIDESIQNDVHAKQPSRCKKLAAQHQEVNSKLLISEEDNEALRQTIQTYEKEREFLKQKEAVQDSMAVNVFAEAFNDDIVL